jgi:DNA (cytosine-5)-methyltransferase 1
MRCRKVKFEFPYDKSTFKDRYTRQSRSEPCSTIVAHLSKDGLMFIHPTQNRSLTPREAARIQSFPDWFRFPTSRTRSFQLIGNAVPPLVGEAVGNAVNSSLERVQSNYTNIKFDLTLLPNDETEAVKRLLPLLELELRALRSVRGQVFKRAWYSIAFLYAGLHPDSALDHGKRKAYGSDDDALLGRLERRLVTPYYKLSGWPVILAPVAKEAWRRYRNGALKNHEFYCSNAQLAGMRYRSLDLIESEGVREERGRVGQVGSIPAAA